MTAVFAEIIESVVSSLPAVSGNQRANSLPSHRILVVDDEPAILELLRTALETRSWTVDVEASPKSAYLRHRKNRYDLVLTDKNMPELDGVELIRRIRRTDSRVRIILMTAFGSLDSAMETGNLSIDAYIEKPFKDVFAVADVIATALEEDAPSAKEEALSKTVAMETANLPAIDDDQMAALKVVVAAAADTERYSLMEHVCIPNDEVLHAPDEAALVAHLEAGPHLLVLHGRMATLAIAKLVRAQAPHLPIILSSRALTLPIAKQLVALKVNVMVNSRIGTPAFRRPVSKLTRSVRLLRTTTG